MFKTGFAVAALSFALASHAAAMGSGPFMGVYGPKGNDTGGIIPWSPENERRAYDYAQENCSYYNKYAVPTSIHRVPGDFITYSCVWESPRSRARYHYR